MSNIQAKVEEELQPLYDHLWHKGLENRRKVVGPEFVSKALSSTNQFTQAGQDLVTQWCWGWTWSRPGLSHRDRSLLNLGMLMALNRPTEFGVHVRGARRNGLSELEIREAIVHAAVYCGVPSGVDGMKIAERTFEEMKEKGEAERELGEKVEHTEEEIHGKS